MKYSTAAVALRAVGSWEIGAGEMYKLVDHYRSKAVGAITRTGNYMHVVSAAIPSRVSGERLDGCEQRVVHTSAGLE